MTNKRRNVKINTEQEETHGLTKNARTQKQPDDNEESTVTDKVRSVQLKNDKIIKKARESLIQIREMMKEAEQSVSTANVKPDNNNNNNTPSDMAWIISKDISTLNSTLDLILADAESSIKRAVKMQEEACGTVLKSHHQKLKEITHGTTAL